MDRAIVDEPYRMKQFFGDAMRPADISFNQWSAQHPEIRILDMDVQLIGNVSLGSHMITILYADPNV